MSYSDSNSYEAAPVVIFFVRCTMFSLGVWLQQLVIHVVFQIVLLSMVSGYHRSETTCIGQSVSAGAAGGRRGLRQLHRVVNAFTKAAGFHKTAAAP